MDNSSFLVGAELTELSFLDPAAFKPKDKSERTACAFVLALALVYNDVKDTMGILNVLVDAKKARKLGTDKYSGEILGVEQHLYRILFSHMNSLFRLMTRPGILDATIVKAALAKLTPEQKAAWDTIVSVSASDAEVEKAGIKSIVSFARNKLVAHPESLEPLLEGYEEFFGEKFAAAQEGAYVSDGESMKATRFYFADAAAQRALDLKITDGDRYRSEIGTLAKALRDGIHAFIAAFVSVRGYKLNVSKYK